MIIAMMWAILVFSTQNSFKKFESKSLSTIRQRLARVFKILKAIAGEILNASFSIRWRVENELLKFILVGAVYVLLLETYLFLELAVIFPDYAIRISLGTFSILRNRI